MTFYEILMTRIVFFGMPGLFSKIPFHSLIEAEANICAVVVPTEIPGLKTLPQQVKPRRPEPAEIPLLTTPMPETIIHLAWQHNIPVWEVGRLTHEKTLALLRQFQPDLICVACFPYLFPSALLNLPQFGCLNLHPSLLPAYRGPTPLFWICHQGERRTGVTLHFLDDGVDSGDIVSQITFALPDGISESDLTRRCASEGAILLVEAIQQLAKGPLPRQPQSEQGSSHYPAPMEEDLHIPTTWSARRAFNFLRGANTWPLTIDMGQTKIKVNIALSYSNHQTLPQTYTFHQDEFWIQFTPGVLRVKGDLAIDLT
jgi:methionyl-tRNA formyltransferase